MYCIGEIWIGKRFESGWKEVIKICCEDDIGIGELEMVEDGFIFFVVCEGLF